MVEMEVRKVTKGVESNMVAFDFERTPITQIADYIIITASNTGTSDIHFDPRDDGMMVRFRIDGDLQDYTYIPKLYERNLTTRLKLLANMNITESRLPQDGAIKGEFGGKYLDMRVSCLPLNTGEKIVIRILDYTRSLQGIDNLGFNQTNLKKIKRMMGVPNGIILITGATGSGKSTTVYSILQGLNRPEINIITVEDPIEMNIEGMNQVQVNAEIGMTFAAALRSILRQDPNVILIGEIRDSETAQIAVRASITGHLVLSTIHTNNSLATIERLLDMDVERYLMSTALTGIVSQRLAKQLCMSCRIERETTKYEKKVFKKFMNRDIEKLYDANPKGCENCRKGYKGRIAIHEVLELDDEIRNAISNPKLKKEELSKMVYNGKTISLLQDALGKAISGLTSFEEVYRVIEMESDPEDDVAYLTKSLDDDEEEKKEVELATDTLDEDTSKQKEKTVPIVEPLKQGETEKKQGTDTTTAATTANKETPKIGADGKEIRDIKDMLKEQNVSNATATTSPQQAQASTPPVTTLTPEQQKAQATAQAQINQPTQGTSTPATLPQVTTLTPEEAKARADAEAAKKAQETSTTKTTADVAPTLLTAEQAQAQAQMAKEKYNKQKIEENEKKIIDLLSKPDQQNANKKKRLVITKPNITPTVVTKIQTKTQQQPQQPQQVQPLKQEEQKPQVLVKQAPPTVPQPEKDENPIPELNISIKTDKDNHLAPTLDDSPIISEEENVFDEKNKVEAVDVNKISKSIDLQKDKELIDNPLIPTVKDDNKKQARTTPVIIDTFDTESDQKKVPVLNEIKKQQIVNETSTTNTTTPEITNIIDEPLIINTKEVKDAPSTTPTVQNENKPVDNSKTTTSEEKTQSEKAKVNDKSIDLEIASEQKSQLLTPKENNKIDIKPEIKPLNLEEDVPELLMPNDETDVKPEIKPLIVETKNNDEADNNDKVKTTSIKTINSEEKPKLSVPENSKITTSPEVKTFVPGINNDNKIKPEASTTSDNKVKIIVKPDGTKVLAKTIASKTDTKNSTSSENEKFKVLVKADGTKVLVRPASAKADTKNENEKVKVLVKPDGTKVLVKPTSAKIDTNGTEKVKVLVKPDGTKVLVKPTTSKIETSTKQESSKVTSKPEIKVESTTPVTTVTEKNEKNKDEVNEKLETPKVVVPKQTPVKEIVKTTPTVETKEKLEAPKVVAPKQTPVKEIVKTTPTVEVKEKQETPKVVVPKQTPVKEIVKTTPTVEVKEKQDAPKIVVPKQTPVKEIVKTTPTVETKEKQEAPKVVVPKQTPVKEIVKTPATKSETKTIASEKSATPKVKQAPTATEQNKNSEKQETPTKRKEIKVVPTAVKKATPTKKVDVEKRPEAAAIKTPEKNEAKTLVKPVGVTKAKTTQKTEANIEKKKATLEVKSITRKNDLNEITDSKETSNKTFAMPEVIQDNRKEEIATVKEINTFELPAITKKENSTADKINKPTSEKKPFITEMKPAALNIPNAKTEEKPKEKTTEPQTEKKPFITEMKVSQVNNSKVQNAEKESTEMKKTTFDLPKVEKNDTKVTNKDSSTTLKEEKESSKKITKPSINIFEEPIDTTNSKMKKPKTEPVENTEELDLDLDIDGELLSLGED